MLRADAEPAPGAGSGFGAEEVKAADAEEVEDLNASGRIINQRGRDPAGTPGPGSLRGNQMKIALTTRGDSLDSQLDQRFGRAPNFLIYNTDDGSSCIKNNTQNLNAAQGAGIQSAIHLAEEHVAAIITGNCGPKAYATLDAAGIEIYTCEECTLAEAVEAFRQGKLAKAGAANVEAHWV